MPSTMASGLQCVAEAVLRRWGTSPGQLIDDPNYGRNVFDLVSDDLTPAQVAYEQQQLAAEAQKDERVLRCSVVLSLPASGVLSLTASILTAAGPFRLVLSVAPGANPPLTVQILLNSP